jgi:hypothetical protein
MEMTNKIDFINRIKPPDIMAILTSALNSVIPNGRSAILSGKGSRARDDGEVDRKEWFEFKKHAIACGRGTTEQGPFLHIHARAGTKKGNETELCRLYLNLSSKSVIPVSRELMARYDQRNEYLYFKIADSTEESDVMIIFTDFDNAGKIVETLKQMRQEMPQHFVGCEKTTISAGQIAGFIGFGESPRYKNGTSYNSERGNVIDILRRDYIIKNTERVVTPKFINPRLIRNNRGEEQDLLGYIAYKIGDRSLDRNLAEVALSRIIYGNETGNEKELIQQLMSIFGEKNSTSMLQNLFTDSQKRNPSYQSYLSQQISNAIASQYPNTGTEESKLVVNRAVYQHLLEIGNKNYNFVNIRAVFPNKTLFLPTGKLLNGYMQQNGINPILPTESEIRKACEKFDVSKDNFCLNQTTVHLLEFSKNARLQQAPEQRQQPTQQNQSEPINPEIIRKNIQNFVNLASAFVGFGDRRISMSEKRNAHMTMLAKLHDMCKNPDITPETLVSAQSKIQQSLGDNDKAMTTDKMLFHTSRQIHYLSFSESLEKTLDKVYGNNEKPKDSMRSLLVRSKDFTQLEEQDKSDIKAFINRYGLISLNSHIEDINRQNSKTN